MSNVSVKNYGEKYQKDQVEKHRNRHHNYWKARVGLLNSLIETYYLRRVKKKDKKNIIAVDIGCSIGTMAIELAKSGYKSYGIDFDSEALKIARQLSEEENVSVEFINEDVSNWNRNFPPIDVAVCFDIFEHLHDDEVGSLLQSVKKQLSPNGIIIFHTFPTEYDHIFFDRSYLRLPLIPFKYLSEKIFDRIVRAYAAFIDILLLLIVGYTYKERLEHIKHCNPTSKQRLRKIFERSGYEILCLQSSNLYPLKKNIQKQFSRQDIAHRNLYGAISIKNNY